MRTFVAFMVIVAAGGGWAIGFGHGIQHAHDEFAVPCHNQYANLVTVDEVLDGKITGDELVKRTRCVLPASRCGKKPL